MALINQVGEGAIAAFAKENALSLGMVGAGLGEIGFGAYIHNVAPTYRDKKKQQTAEMRSRLNTAVGVGLTGLGAFRLAGPYFSRRTEEAFAKVAPSPVAAAPMSERPAGLFD